MMVDNHGSDLCYASLALHAKPPPVAIRTQFNTNKSLWSARSDNTKDVWSTSASKETKPEEVLPELKRDIPQIPVDKDQKACQTYKKPFYKKYWMLTAFLCFVVTTSLVNILFWVILINIRNSYKPYCMPTIAVEQKKAKPQAPVQKFKPQAPVEKLCQSPEADIQDDDYRQYYSHIFDTSEEAKQAAVGDNVVASYMMETGICLDRIQFIQSAGGETVCCTSLYGAIRFTRNVDIYKRVSKWSQLRNGLHLNEAGARPCDCIRCTIWHYGPCFHHRSSIAVRQDRCHLGIPSFFHMRETLPIRRITKKTLQQWLDMRKQFNCKQYKSGLKVYLRTNNKFNTKSWKVCNVKIQLKYISDEYVVKLEAIDGSTGDLGYVCQELQQNDQYSIHSGWSGYVEFDCKGIEASKISIFSKNSLLYSITSYSEEINICDVMVTGEMVGKLPYHETVHHQYGHYGEVEDDDDDEINLEDNDDFHNIGYEEDGENDDDIFHQLPNFDFRKEYK